MNAAIHSIRFQSKAKDLMANFSCAHYKTLQVRGALIIPVHAVSETLKRAILILSQKLGMKSRNTKHLLLQVADNGKI